MVIMEENKELPQFVIDWEEMFNELQDDSQEYVTPSG